jgi:integrase
MLRPEQVRAALASGKNQRLADGHNLYLLVKNGNGFWVHNFRDPKEGGKNRWHSFGSAATMTAAAARRARESFMSAVREGRPVAIASKKTAGALFSAAADSYLSNHADEWSDRTRAANIALVANKVPTEFKARAVTAITPDHVAEVLRPIWSGPGANAGSKLRQLIEGILASKDIAPNPASWDRLKSRLSTKRAAVAHHEAMPFSDVPAFVAKLSDSIEDRAGRFVILTAVRRKEALAATWREFDLKAKLWQIRGDRMNSRKPHTVPLTDAMIACLGKPGERDDYVFTNAAGGPLNDSHAALDKTWVPGFTLHGFRSSFASWAESIDHGRRFAPATIEGCLAHAKGNAVTTAYLRNDLIDARRDLLQAWGEFVTAQIENGLR